MDRKPRVHILGLGPGPIGLITLETMEILERAEEVLVRTLRHPAVKDLPARGVRTRSLDHYYEDADSMEGVYRAIAAEVVKEAKASGEAFYATPGFPLMAERTVQLILAEEVEAIIHPAVSFLDGMLVLLKFDPVEGLLILEADRLIAGGYAILDPRTAAIISQVDSRLKASDIKLVLLEVYPALHEIKIVREDRIEEIPLEELDREERFDHLTSIFIPRLPENEIFDFRRLIDIIARLRGPAGCPWDRKQTHESLARHMVEEAHEAVDAIQQGDWEHLSEELGDLLLQVALHAQLGSEEDTFDIRDTLRLITEKLLRRHPHVFGEAELHTPEEVIARWERIKADERGEASVLDGVAGGLPALLYAFKLQSRAARIGFDWERGEDVLPKLEEELHEIREVLRGGEGDLEDELGDLLFTLVNVSRHYQVDPEIALRRAARKFALRFQCVEAMSRERGLLLEEMSLEELDALWEAAKERSC
ncbi:MAG: nucleoside triphosphate pyrophosphohydrolase [Candidatus Solincola sediminis]|uniref:Nucleoside triphosphate pyrophosphohydrolase n=1 Tax=Candidatus Solincola sediminis TaxID=1797199 RepID=A0A1F2WLI9_9ACTN|nr:MAG: nucleoside triphosphate pyrophosphohydrolase [Candidatus Solincola sediminis]OFW58604.1 MAG: nucleoside triphosphate pyrophosphohydrolase [Candidatus Solincola sediminis]